MRNALKYGGGGVLGAGLMTLWLGGQAYAQDAEPDPTQMITDLATATNLLWVVIGAVLVILMQAGFALVEAGFTQKKNANHVFSTNFAIFGLGFVGFLLLGFPLAFGGFSYSAFGLTEPMNGDGLPLLGGANSGLLYWGYDHLGNAASPALLGFFLYMVAFMDTVATIPTGAMAERWKWNSFAGWGVFCGAIYYPLFAAWTWGGGWLAKSWETMSLGAGYVDFAGSGVVHSVGAAAGLSGALVLGPRLGKYRPDGTPNAILPHNIPMAQLGCFILLFGWFGFNAASTFAATDVQFATVAANTAIAGAVGAVVSMWYVQAKTKKVDAGMMVNGMLAGLVAVTAPCAFIAPWAAALIGLVSAVIVVEAAWFIERKGIDDPVGAVAVHGVGGGLGVLFVGIFANGRYGAGWNGSTSEGVKGVIEGDWGQLGAQALGLLVIWTVILGISYAFWKTQAALMKGGIRAPVEWEEDGLDIPELGVLAYND